MSDDSKGEPLTSPRAMLKGWIAGSLLLAGLLIWWLFPLVIFAIVIFLDAVIAVRGYVHIMTTIIFAVIGGIISIAAAISGVLPLYAALVVIVTLLSYALFLKRPRGNIFSKLRKAKSNRTGQ